MSVENKGSYDLEAYINSAKHRDTKDPDLS